jgi:molybdate transport system substrate-binding protein
MKHFWIFFLAVTLLLSACGPAAPANPAPTGVPPTQAPPLTATPAPRRLTVFAAASLAGSFTELGKNFEAAHAGVSVKFNFAGSQVLSTQIIQGAEVDVFASANHTEMDKLVSADLVLPGTPRDFVTNQLEVILPANNPANLQTLQDLDKPGLKLVLGDKSVPVGKYSLTILDNLGKDATYGAEFQTRVLTNVVSFETDVKQVVAKVQLGEADAGMVYITDAIAAPALKTIAIPANFNIIAKYPIAALSQGPRSELAEEFVAYVLSADGQASMEKWGFTPVKP